MASRLGRWPSLAPAKNNLWETEMATVNAYTLFKSTAYIHIILLMRRVKMRVTERGERVEFRAQKRKKSKCRVANCSFHDSELVEPVKP